MKPCLKPAATREQKNAGRGGKPRGILPRGVEPWLTKITSAFSILERFCDLSTSWKVMGKSKTWLTVPSTGWHSPINVFPVPGGPKRRSPRGGPRSPEKMSGLSMGITTISLIIFFTFASPAMSSQWTGVPVSIISFSIMAIIFGSRFLLPDEPSSSSAAAAGSELFLLRWRVTPGHLYWTVILILVWTTHISLGTWQLTNSKIAVTKALEPLKSWHFCFSNFWTCWSPNKIWVVQD